MIWRGCGVSIGSERIRPNCCLRGTGDRCYLQVITGGVGWLFLRDNGKQRTSHKCGKHTHGFNSGVTPLRLVPGSKSWGCRRIGGECQMVFPQPFCAHRRK